VVYDKLDGLITIIVYQFQSLVEKERGILNRLGYVGSF